MSDLDRYLDDFGRTLERATTPIASPPRRRRRLVTAGGLTAALAGGLVAIFALPGAQERIDPVEEARAALATQGQIVHTVVGQRSRLRGADGRFAPARPVDSLRIEQWSTPSRFRVVSTSKAFPTVEVAQDGDVQRLYDRQRNRLSIMRGVRKPKADSPAPLAGALGADPLVRVRELLDDGDVRDAGVTTVDGRQVRRLVGENRFSIKRGTVVVAFEYHVEPDDFAPIALRIETRQPDDPRRHVFTATFETYERLEPTAENARLLTIDTKPNPKVIVQRIKR